MAASDVVNVIDQIMKLKGSEIKNLDNGTGQVTATIDDVTYTLGMINWKIGQLYSE